MGSEYLYHPGGNRGVFYARSERKYGKSLKIYNQSLFCLLSFDAVFGWFASNRLEAQTTYQADYTDLTGKINEQLIKQSEMSICRVVKTILVEEKISYEKISADVNILSDNSIFISKIYIELPVKETKNLQKVRQLVKEECQIETQVVLSS